MTVFIAAGRRQAVAVIAGERLAGDNRNETRASPWDNLTPEPQDAMQPLCRAYLDTFQITYYAARLAPYNSRKHGRERFKTKRKHCVF